MASPSPRGGGGAIEGFFYLGCLSAPGWRPWPYEGQCGYNCTSHADMESYGTAVLADVSEGQRVSSVVQGGSQNRREAVQKALEGAEDVLSPEGRRSIDVRLPPQRRQAPAQRTPPANVRCCPLPQLPLAWTRHLTWLMPERPGTTSCTNWVCPASWVQPTFSNLASKQGRSAGGAWSDHQAG